MAVAPSFTSAAAASVPENSSGTIYRAVASDPQNRPVTFSIVGGADAGAFQLAGDGALTFSSPPNFDLPADSDGNNVYEVVLRASAGGQSADLTLAVTVSNLREGIKVTRVASGFTRPVALSTVFDGEKLLVAEQFGRVAFVDGATGAITERDDIEAGIAGSDIVSAAYAGRGMPFIDGLYFLTFNQASGLLLQLYSPATGRTARKLLDLPSSEPFTGKVFRGELGHVFVAVGDPGGTRAQLPSSGYGKLWSSFAYDPYAGASLPSNPTVFVSLIGEGIAYPGGGGEINGETWFADRAIEAENEISFFSAANAPLDFGWPFYEGTTAIAANPPPLEDGPTLTYPKGTAGVNRGIVGGALYTGSIAGIRNHFVFGDLDGRIWSIPLAVLKDGNRHGPADIELRTLDFTPDQGTIDGPVAFEITGSGTIYILDLDGEIFRVDSA